MKALWKYFPVERTAFITALILCICDVQITDLIWLGRSHHAKLLCVDKQMQNLIKGKWIPPNSADWLFGSLHYWNDRSALGMFMKEPTLVEVLHFHKLCNATCILILFFLNIRGFLYMCSLVISVLISAVWFSLHIFNATFPVNNQAMLPSMTFGWEALSAMGKASWIFVGECVGVDFANKGYGFRRIFGENANGPFLCPFFVTPN